MRQTIYRRGARACGILSEDAKRISRRSTCGSRSIRALALLAVPYHTVRRRTPRGCAMPHGTGLPEPSGRRRGGLPVLRRRRAGGRDVHDDPGRALPDRDPESRLRLGLAVRRLAAVARKRDQDLPGRAAGSGRADLHAAGTGHDGRLRERIRPRAVSRRNHREQPVHGHAAVRERERGATSSRRRWCTTATAAFRAAT